MTEWNAAAPHSPTFHEITTLTEDLYVGSYPLPDGVYASTSITSQGSAPYHITYTHTTFNSEVVWNRSLDFHVANPEPGTYIYHADARKVANHELGHAQGLGHTGNTAVMRQGATTYYHLQTDDKTGIAAVYP